MIGIIKLFRQQGVVELAAGFGVGGTVSKLIKLIVTDAINPIPGIMSGTAGNLQNSFLQIGPAHITWWIFLNKLIVFLIITFVVYINVKIFKLDKLEKFR